MWNHTGQTSQRSLSCPSVCRCSPGMASEGPETEGRSQVHMEHFDRVALTPEPEGEGTGWKERKGAQKSKVKMIFQVVKYLILCTFLTY